MRTAPQWQVVLIMVLGLSLWDSRDGLCEVTPIRWGGERFWPVLHEASDLPADDSKEGDRLGGLRSVRDADLSDDLRR